MAIEILENTLLKLLVRRGTDSDRKQITLESGELGFTTDTERLYIGNSTTPGGIVAGNRYKGRAADLTSLAPVVTGDYAYETDTHSLKICIAGSGAVETDWLTVANQVSAGDGTIVIGSQSLITVGTLSAGNFHPDALGSSLELDGSNRVALSGTINIDNITQRTTSATNYLSLPSKLKINAHNYDFPKVGPENFTYLGANATGLLSWSVPDIVQSTVAPTTASLIPVATIVPFASGASRVPYGWLSCDGGEYLGTTYPDLSAAIGSAYNTGGETGDDGWYFRVPDLNNKVMYGYPDPGFGGATGAAATSTLMGVTTAQPAYSTTTLLSATGMHYMIKSIGGTTNPTLTVQKNLSAFVNTVDKTGTTFNPLSGDVLIERPAPGMVVFKDGHGADGSSGTFTMPAGIHYIKCHVTGAGARGGQSPGGAAATAIGNLSAAPGTVFKIRCAQGPPSGTQDYTDVGADGDYSAIYANDEDSTELLRADGGLYDTTYQTGAREAAYDALPPPTGLIAENPHVLGGYIVPGASGWLDTTQTDEESTGVAGFWGNAPAPGGGASADRGRSPTGGGLPGNGIVMIEWS